MQVNHYALHIEPFTQRLTRLINENPEIGIEVFIETGNLIRSMIKNPHNFGITSLDLDIFAKVGINPQDKKSVIDSMDIIKSVGSQTVKSLAASLGNTLVIRLESSDPIKNEIIKGVGEGLTTLLLRVSNRIKTQGREDDLKLGTYLLRLATYYEETAIIPIEMGAMTLPAGGDYVQAVEDQLKAMVLQININYNFDSELYKQFSTLTRMLYLIRVSK